MDVAILIVWVVFWLGWLVSAFGANRRSDADRKSRPLAVLVILIGAVVIRVIRPGGPNGLMVHAPVVRVLGAALIVCGLSTAVWARIAIGRDWGMPMSEKEHPELVTSGPYQLVRHPIYLGILLAIVGTALAVNLGWLVVAVALGVLLRLQRSGGGADPDRGVSGGLTCAIASGRRC